MAAQSLRNVLYQKTIRTNGFQQGCGTVKPAPTLHYNLHILKPWFVTLEARVNRCVLWNSTLTVFRDVQKDLAYPFALEFKL